MVGQSPACAFGPLPVRWLLLLMLLSVAVAWAADQSRLEIGPGYEDALSDEIYGSAGKWRVPPSYDAEWRAPAGLQDQGRIRLGYDSIYEARRARENAWSKDDRSATSPATLLRWEF